MIKRTAAVCGILFALSVAFSSCGFSNKSIVRMQHLEEGVDHPTSVEELKDAISKYQKRVADVQIAQSQIGIWYKILGTFGSRQEEAQRLGRILRPKERMSRFFTLITRSTVEEDFGSNRQKFLAEQGYSYRIIRYTTKDDLNELQEGIGACNEYK